MECPENEYFSAKTGGCDARERVPCAVKPPRAIRMDDISMVCPPRGEFSYPHPENCGIYFMCINGISAMLDCGPVLRFDVMSLQCVVPEKAQCITKFK